MQRRKERIIHLVTVAVALVHHRQTVDGRGAAALGQHDVHAAHARILSAIVLVHAVARNRYHRRVCQPIDFRRVRVRKRQKRPNRFHHAKLHSVANHQAGDTLRAREVRRRHHPLRATVPEAAGEDDAVIAAQPFRGVCCRQLVRGDIVHIHRREVCDACMDKRFVHRQVCIMHSNVLADQRDMHFLRRRVISGDHVRPLGQIRRGIVKLQRFQHHARQSLFFQIQRHFKQRGRIPVLHDVAHRHIAEQRDFVLCGLADVHLCAADDNIRLNADGAQGLDRVLRRLRFHFARNGQIRHQDEACVARAKLPFQLANRLQIRGGLDIARHAADFDNRNIRAGVFRRRDDAVLDFVRHMRHDRNRRAVVFAAQLALHQGSVNLAGGDARFALERLVDKALVVP